MLKKLVSILLVLVMTFSLAACSSDTGATKEEETTAETETTDVAATDKAADTATEEADTTADAEITLTFAHADNETSIFHQGALAFKEKLEELSGGKIQVQIYPSGQMGTLADAAQGIQMGTIDVAPISATVLANFSSNIAVYDLPFIVESYEQAYASLDGEVGDTLEQELQNSGMLCKGWWTLGFRNTTCNSDVATIDDLKGLKIRTQDSKIHIAIFEALGINATPMGFSEMFTALQQGTVDGQENPYVNILQANIYEVNDTLVQTEHVFQVAGLLVSPSTYDKLSAEQQAMVDEASAYATEVERAACENDNEAAKDTLINEKGMKYVELDKAQLQEMTASVYDSYPELAELADKVKSYK